MPILRNTAQKSPQRSRRRRSVRKTRRSSSLNRRILGAVWLVAAAAIGVLIWHGPAHVMAPQSECNALELHTAAESGRDAAAAVALTTRAGSMEREKAILDIRAREYRIRTAGFPTAADSFAAAAAARLKADRVI